MNHLKSFLCQDEGVTAIEYALIALGIAVVIVVAVAAVGTSLIPVFNTVASKI